MSKKTQFIALLLSDATMLFVANWLFYLARFEWGWFIPPQSPVVVIAAPVVLLSAFWLAGFFFFGMYRERFAESRLGELLSLARVVTIGILVLFFILFIEQLDAGDARANLAFYWLVVFGCVAVGRIGIRSVQKALILRGHGTHKTLIVGWSDRVEQVYQDVAKYPAAGLNVVGALRLRRDEDPAVPVAAGLDPGPVRLQRGDGAGTLAIPSVEAGVESIATLPRLIDELEVQDVLIALGSADHDYLLEVLRVCDRKPVSLKLVPDFYTVIGGMSRTEHMYGLPLIEVLPEPMPAWAKSTKRLIDFAVALVVVGVGIPVWVLIGLIVRMQSPGPAIYRQQRVGENGRTFTMYKYRTMVNDAEAGSGPVWARNDDPRYTAFGRWLRRTRLDEVPQFWNVLKGEMSLVGPRPERPFFVEQLSGEIPLYSRRLRVKPGITGWAQVMWKYDETIEDVRQKVKYDLFYIENMSLLMDFQILFRTIRTALSGKGQ
jgi:exopolysaccharide biosynthesis polyprenyl glycosylphosphotransferase